MTSISTRPPEDFSEPIQIKNLYEKWPQKTVLKKNSPKKKDFFDAFLLQLDKVTAITVPTFILLGGPQAFKPLNYRFMALSFLGKSTAFLSLAYNIIGINQASDSLAHAWKEGQFVRAAASQTIQVFAKAWITSFPLFLGLYVAKNFSTALGFAPNLSLESHRSIPIPKMAAVYSTLNALITLPCLGLATVYKIYQINAQGDVPS